jgi:hypothetical protein
MSRRKVDPETGGPALTWRENKMIDGFVSNGGNASQAAVDAGYSPKNPSQSAWKVLNRPAVQEQIRARIQQARIDPGEPIGSLVSQMRADVTDCFGPDGAFSIDLARQNGLGHLLKVSTTVQRKTGKDGCLRTIGDATRIEFLSPQTAALQLARFSTAAHPDSAHPGSAEDRQPQETDQQRLTLIAKLVERTQQKFPGITLEEIFESILDARPELAPYVHKLRLLLAASVQTDSRGADPRQADSSG